MRLRKLALLSMLVAMTFLVALPALAQEGDAGSGTPVDWVWLNGLIAFFLPLVISLFKKNSWSPKVKRTLALVISSVVGIATIGAENAWVFEDFFGLAQLVIASITQVWVVAQVAYLSFWEDTKTEVAASKALMA